jgi:hypothetical protein
LESIAELGFTSTCGVEIKKERRLRYVGFGDENSYSFFEPCHFLMVCPCVPFVLFPGADSLQKSTLLVAKLTLKLGNESRLLQYIGALIDGQTAGECMILGRQELDLGVLVFDLLKGDIQGATLLGQFNVLSRNLRTPSAKVNIRAFELDEPLRGTAPTRRMRRTRCQDCWKTIRIEERVGLRAR